MAYLSKRKKVQQAWKEVSYLHPKVRAYQNNLVSELLDTKVNLKPAEIKTVNPVIHWLHGDYFGLASKRTDTIMMSSHYYTEWKEISNEYAKSEIPSFSEYVLGRVANAEGTRTANHVLKNEIIFGRWEWDGMFYTGDYLGSESMIHLGIKPIPLEESVNLALKKRKKLAKALKNPLNACRYVMIQEDRLSYN